MRDIWGIGVKHSLQDWFGATIIWSLCYIAVPICIVVHRNIHNNVFTYCTIDL